ncbi:hypothetical protein EXIGLDRAFT_728502 [Exidia glandulosa HHB12029]|uniref:DUF6533 domain-containing protein n=1 Tax=Exidia glandulosa HHB12029 TaxID=1314781 RepID=A0A165CWA8_EXIGL|nr:hypothetical protein EXIGLDRAFT_728502 [Exidia glandulosa HHB12029]
MDALAVDTVHFTQVTRCSHVAAYSLLVWDWLLNIAEERKLIFGSRWTPAKVAYLVSRYYPLLTYPLVLWVQLFDHDKALCSHIYNLPILIVIPNNISAECILILRTFAFTGGNKPILYGLLTLLAGLVAFQLWVATTAATMIPFGNGCFPVNSGSKLFLSGFFISTFILDSIITLIFAVFAFRMIRLRLTVATRLTQLLIREGFVYFCLISAVNLVNASFNLQTGNVAMATGAVPLSLLFCNVLSCRLVLNLRRVARQDAIPGGVHTPEKSTFYDEYPKERNKYDDDDDDNYDYPPIPPPKDNFSFHEISGTWSSGSGTVSAISMPPAAQVPSYHSDYRWMRANAKWERDGIGAKSFESANDDLEALSVAHRALPGSLHIRTYSSMSERTLVT